MTVFNAFIGPSYEAASYRADVEQTINLYTEKIESGGATTDRVLLPTPGFLTVFTTALAPIRAEFAQDGRMFAVIGFAFFEIFYDAVTEVFSGINRGNVANDGLPATIQSSGDAGRQLGICAGGNWYNYDLLTDVLTLVPSAGTGLIQGAYLDGYFLALDDTSTFKLSDLLDGTVWDPLQVAQRNDAPDQWRALLVVGKYVWLFGSETTTVLYDAGAFPFPFTLVPGVLINRGIGAVHSARDLDGAAVWLSQSRSGARMIVRANAFGVPDRISNHAVEAALASYSTVADAVAWVYNYQGHWFYQINFPTADASWSFDATSGEWFQPLYWNQGSSSWSCSRAQTHCFAFDRHLVGDRETGTIYELSGTTYTDAGGTPLRRVRRCPFPRVLGSGDFVNVTDLELFMDVGIGLVSGQGVDPQVMMRISRDSGRTWGNEHWTSAGAVGKYATRVNWHRLGRFRDGRGVLEVVVSDPVPIRLTGATFEAARGAP